MSERIDHVAETYTWIVNAIEAQKRRGGANDILAGAYASIANAEATLALVEQQRIANLIALANTCHTSLETQVADDAVNALSYWLYHENTDMGGWREPRPEIKEALGL